MEKVCFKSKSGFHTGVTREWAEKAQEAGYGYVCDEKGNKEEVKKKTKRAPAKK